MNEMQEEHPRPKRQSLDRMHLRPGAMIRIYFPWDTPPLLMSWTGKTREHTGSRATDDFEFKESSGKLRWIPGWYIAHNA